MLISMCLWHWTLLPINQDSGEVNIVLFAFLPGMPHTFYVQQKLYPGKGHRWTPPNKPTELGVVLVCCLDVCIFLTNGETAAAKHDGDNDKERDHEGTSAGDVIPGSSPVSQPRFLISEM